MKAPEGQPRADGDPHYAEENFTGVVDLLKMKASGTKPTRHEV
jgi:hypothetical protein